jgi:hypothetical protein
MNPKIKQMNAWKKYLKAKGVTVPRGMKYDELQKLYDKHDGPNKPRRKRSEGNSKTTSSRSSRTRRKSSGSTRKGKGSLFGWAHVL